MSFQVIKGSAYALAFLIPTFTGQILHAERSSSAAGVQIVATRGDTQYRDTGGAWRSLKPGADLGPGGAIRTGTYGRVDFLLRDSGTTLCLPPNSEVRFEVLRALSTGEESISTTRLRLTEGSIVGSQRKLHRPSSFEIVTREGKAIIVGTEYVVRADGAVSVLRGSVSMIYNLPGAGGSVKVTIQQGESFDPATGTVISTTPEFLDDLIAEVETVRHNAEVYKAGGATVVVKPEKFLSPTKGNNGVGNGVDPQPPGNPPINDGPGTGPGNPGNRKGGG